MAIPVRPCAHHPCPPFKPSSPDRPAQKWNLRYLRMDEDTLQYYKTMKSSSPQGTIPIEVIDEVCGCVFQSS